MKGPISFIVFLCLLMWGCYRCWGMKKTPAKQERIFYGLIMSCITQLTYYPLWIPLQRSFALLGLLGVLGLIYKVFFQKREKNLLIFAGILFLFALYFFLIKGEPLLGLPKFSKS